MLVDTAFLMTRAEIESHPLYHDVPWAYYKCVESLANWVLLSLYDKVEEDTVYALDKKRIKGDKRIAEAFRSEPINWGTLGAYALEPVGSEDKAPPQRFDVIIEEAAPSCHNLCAYVQSWLKKWGWDVTVHTEW